MLELGVHSDDLHAALAPAIEAADVDRVYACGQHMKSLWKKLPEQCQGSYAPTAEELQPMVLDAIQRGDAVMVKASKGSKLTPVVEAIKKRFAAENTEAAQTATLWERACSFT